MSMTETAVKKYEDLLKKHQGKWVAIAEDRVIAVAESPDELRTRVKQYNDVFVGYSPTPEEKKMGYLL